MTPFAPLVVTAALTAYPALPSQTRPPARAERATVSVAVEDYASVPGDWLRQARTEMTRIYREAGVEIAWWDSNNLPVPQNLLIVMIRQTEDFARPYPNSAVGAASGTAADRGRVAYVFYDRAEQFPPLYRGRFLGHFMAHEVGHLLLPQYSHSPTGLMRAQWTREDLERAQNGGLGFTSEQAAVIRARAAELAAGTSAAR